MIVLVLRGIPMFPVKYNSGDVSKGDFADILGDVPESSVWLANFTSRQTRRTYKMAILHFVAAMGFDSEDHWHKVKPALVIAWREMMVESGLSDRTIQTRLSALSSLFNHLCEKQIVADNPVRSVRRPQVNSDQVTSVALSRKQAVALLDAPPRDTLIGLRNRAILATFLYTGSRIESICQLRVKDFFDDSGYMVLDFKVKGGRIKRVALNPRHISILKHYLMKTGLDTATESALFGRMKGKGRGEKMTQANVRYIVKKYARIAGLSEKITPHSARATFITEALDAGVPIEQVQRTVDHKNIATTKMYDKREFKHRDSATFKVNY